MHMIIQTKPFGQSSQQNIKVPGHTCSGMSLYPVAVTYGDDKDRQDRS